MFACLTVLTLLFSGVIYFMRVACVCAECSSALSRDSSASSCVVDQWSGLAPLDQQLRTSSFRPLFQKAFPLFLSARQLTTSRAKKTTTTTITTSSSALQLSPQPRTALLGSPTSSNTMEDFLVLCCGMDRRKSTSALTTGLSSTQSSPRSTERSYSSLASGITDVVMKSEPQVRPMNELKMHYRVDWTSTGELGRGHFAQVYKGAEAREGGRPVACKRIARSLTRAGTLHNEIKALSACQGHPNIVALYDVFFDDIYVVLVLEYLGGGELFARIIQGGAYSERDASRHAKSLASALSYMHARGIVHRDLKPENLVLSEPRLDSPIKISDFGLSKIISDDTETMKTVCGTRAYSAPEVNFGHKASSYTAKVDVWSLGVILYILLGGYRAFFLNQFSGARSSARLIV